MEIRLLFNQILTSVRLYLSGSSNSSIGWESTVRHPVITKPRLMSEFGRVAVTNKVGPSATFMMQIMTDYQSEQLDFEKSGD